MSIATKPTKSELTAERMRTIAYNMDLLIPGFYLWAGNFVMQLGGEKPDDRPYRYPGTLHSKFGMALVLPGYRILTTDRGTYDSEQTPMSEDEMVAESLAAWAEYQKNPEGVSHDVVKQWAESLGQDDELPYPQ